MSGRVDKKVIERQTVDCKEPPVVSDIIRFSIRGIKGVWLHDQIVKSISEKARKSR